jgi:hypothetical protein
MRLEVLARLRPGLALVGILAALLGACAPVTVPSPEGGVTATPSLEPSLSLLAERMAPPTAYAQVSRAYTEMEDWVLVRGATVSDLLIREDAAALYRRFSPELQAELAQDQWDRYLAELTAIAPVGPRVDFRTLSVGRVNYYLATHSWGAGILQVMVGFDAPGALAGIDLSPREAPPVDQAAVQQRQVAFRLPFDGLWYVAWGGPDELYNYHARVPAQRYAFDFMVWVDGSTCRGRCEQKEDYYAFGQPILAPADGTVVAVVGDQPDLAPHRLMQATELGNHLLLHVAEGQYILIAHMQQGSLLVGTGDQVQAGQPLGRVGNSGGASEPHLHIHLQDSEHLALEGPEGLPLFFSDYLSDGEPMIHGMPRGSQFVQHQP